MKIRVTDPSMIEAWLERNLMRVQKPGRYVGGELNQVVKDWASIPIKVALAFPDVYEIGVPNLALTILYETINQRPDALAERVYLPWVDMEALMRDAGIPLYGLETKHPLNQFDILGITLPYEALYTNVLNLLDLAGIPLFSTERNEQHPLIIAGGHATFNPEPMSPFIDAFVIGEGEDVIHEILDTIRDWKAQSGSRDDLLHALLNIPGVYIPRFYRPHYHPDGTLRLMERLTEAAPPVIHKRILGRLPPPPTRPIVPSIDVVHNRVAIEIMRGCTRGCRFCHAGMVTRPVRERSVEEILSAIQEALKNTGYEEVALLSLSSSDYSQITHLVERVSHEATRQHLVISLPSLRIETVSVELMERLKGKRQSSSFTLAPEAATDRMRAVINKPIETGQLLETARAIFQHGWSKIKLYFMIGHPTETLEDVKAIAEVSRQVLAEGRRIIGHRASLHLGVSTFVPKPHTPFQWLPCDTPEQIKTKQHTLLDALKGTGIKINWTDPRETLLEAWLSRGDRRLAEVIYNAWTLGAKFDAWHDHFDYEKWMTAFQMVNLDPAFYTHRQRSLDEVFPWDHISPGVRKAYLQQEYLNSLQGVLRLDCRRQCYACGILPTYKELRRKYPGQHWKCPEVPVHARA